MVRFRSHGDRRPGGEWIRTRPRRPYPPRAQRPSRARQRRSLDDDVDAAPPDPDAVAEGPALACRRGRAVLQRLPELPPTYGSGIAEEAVPPRLVHRGPSSPCSLRRHLRRERRQHHEPRRVLRASREPTIAPARKRGTRARNQCRMVRSAPDGTTDGLERSAGRPLAGQRAVLVADRGEQRRTCRRHPRGECSGPAPARR
jgi:hypothetical protein